MINRRRFIVDAATLAGLASITACGPGQTTSDGRAARQAADVALLNRAIEMEQRGILIYQAAVQTKLLEANAAARSLVQRFLTHHQQHSKALISAITQLGGEPRLPQLAPPELPAAITAPAKPTAERMQALLVFARQVELKAAQLYFQFLTQELQTSLGRRFADDIMPVEAQHVAVYDGLILQGKPAPTSLLSEQF